MSLKSIIAREPREMREGIGGRSRSSSSRPQQLPRGGWKRQTLVVGTRQVDDEADDGGGGEDEVDGGRASWANLPPELLLEVIRRVEASEPSWPGRNQVVMCASVCSSWRDITKNVARTLEESSRITFPTSLKQPGPRNSPIQCYIRRERATSTFLLYLGLSPAPHGSYGKLLFAAHKVKRATSTDFIISLMPGDYSRASNMYIGKLKPNFLGTKFTVYDSQAPNESTVRANCRSNRRVHAKQIATRVHASSYNVTTITYELSVLRARGPRRMQCTMHFIPVSAILDGGIAPTPTSFCQSVEEQFSLLSIPRPKNPLTSLGSTSRLEPSMSIQTMGEPLVLKNKAPRWHDQLQCWCLNFRGRVTVASVKNFQLVAAVEPHHQLSPAEQERVILQFGKIGKDIFTMDYQYPISAFQAFAICLSSFDTKPACE